MVDRSYDEHIAHNPHDGLARRIFSNPEAAAAELQLVLPQALTSRLDWHSLKVEPTSFVDERLRSKTSDILYSIELAESARPVSVYVVMEHQSSPDAAMTARFFVYVGRLYERYLDQHEGTKTVPLVVPVLLYQGPSGWAMPQRLSEMLDVPRVLLERFPPPIELVFAVDDMSQSMLGEQVTHDQLRRDHGVMLAELARTWLWLYNHPDGATGERAAMLGRLTRALVDGWGPRSIEPFLTYFLSAFGADSPLHAILLESAEPETQHMHTTFRDDYLAQGKAKGLATALDRLLTARGVELTEGARERITSCEDEAVLQRWFDRAVTAASVAEVFDD
ncbi:MAG: Rpn family recombination-promoting nuclease/putative transposase [Myxococcota bacterium]